MGSVRRFFGNRGVVVIFLLALCLSDITVCRAAAFSGKLLKFQCISDSGNIEEADDFQSVLEFFGMSGKGGTVVLLQSGAIIQRERKKRYILPKGVTLSIPFPVMASVGVQDLYLRGRISLYGRLDLNASSGLIIDEGGGIDIYEDGIYSQRRCVVENTEKPCFCAADIFAGQALSEARIDPSSVAWTASVPGKWSFAQPEYMPGVGTGLYDIQFTPDNALSYKKEIFPASGQVNVKPTSTPAPTPAPIAALPVEDSGKDGQDPGQDSERTGVPGVVAEQGDGGQEPVIIRQMPAVLSSLVIKAKNTFSGKRPRIMRILRRGTRAKITWKKVARAKGYQVCCSAARSVKKGKKVTAKGNQIQFRRLKKKKHYYVRVRAYKGKKKRTYTAWSSWHKI